MGNTISTMNRTLAHKKFNLILDFKGKLHEFSNVQIIEDNQIMLDKFTLAFNSVNRYSNENVRLGKNIDALSKLILRNFGTRRVNLLVSFNGVLMPLIEVNNSEIPSILESLEIIDFVVGDLDEEGKLLAVTENEEGFNYEISTALK